MKTGKTLMELAQELQRIQTNKRDFIVPTSALEMTDKGELQFTNGETHAFMPTGHAGRQIATYTDIPQAYYDRLREERPDLLASNVNHGLRRLDNQTSRGKRESRMVRTIDGKARAFLSSQYRTLDAYDMLETVFPVMQDKGLQVDSCELTERRMYIKALSPRLTTEITKGDVVQYGIVLSTSDVGAGTVRVEPLIYRLVCLNGMISNTAIRAFHRGKNQAQDEAFELYTDQTKELTDKAFWSQVRDIVVGSLEPMNFNREVDRLREAAGQKIENFDLPKVVELTAKAVGINGEKTMQSIVAQLASGNQGAGLTKWGLINSITAAAQGEHLDFDQSVELERAAGKVLELSPNEWKRIAVA